MSLIPGAIKHIQTYPPATLDGTTLRHLRDECEGWLASHNRITDEFKSRVVEGLSTQDGLDHWNDTFKDDVAATEATLATVKRELDSRFSSPVG
jgi:hypothetical protein